MDTRSKKYKKEKKRREYDPRILRLLQRLSDKRAKIAAFAAAAVMFGGFCAAGAAYERLNEKLGVISDESDSYSMNRSYRTLEMYEQLCIYSACYLQNVNDDWQFTGSENMMEDFLYYLDYNDYSYKQTSDGIVPVSDVFDFYVSWNDTHGSRRSASNIDFPKNAANEKAKITYLTEKGEFPDYLLRYDDRIISDEVSSGVMETYSYPTAEIVSGTNDMNKELEEYGEVNGYPPNKDGEISEEVLDTYYHNDAKSYYQNIYENGNYRGDLKDENYADNFLPLGGWYSDNYGRYFYNFGNESPIIFYDDPASTKAGKLARDGGTYDDWFWSEKLDQYMPLSYFTKSNSYYDANSSEMVFSALESRSDYEAYRGKTSSITVFLSPKPQAAKAFAAEFKTSRILSKFAAVIKLVTLVVFSLAMLYVLAVSGFKGTEGNTIVWGLPATLKKLPSEAAAAAAILGAALVVFAEGKCWMIYNNLSSGTSMIVGLFLYTLAIAGASLVELIFLSVTAGLIKSGCVAENSLLVKLLKKIVGKYRSSESYKQQKTLSAGDIMRRRMKRSTVIVVTTGVAALLISGLYGLTESLVLFGIIALIILIKDQVANLRSFRDFELLSRQIRSIGDSNVGQTPALPEKSCFYNDSRELAEIDRRVRESVEEQVKAERMKIELVANVSHDLKTPLTSIISYIDLLGKLPLDDEAKTYVEILDRKSQRLKAIVADVFTLAKATSGIDVNLIELDFVMLINQVLAASDDAISASGMTIKKEITLTQAYVSADSDKLSRVFQNLIDNALAYSMDGTRIFLELRQIGSDAVFTVKNISAQPINFTPDEIVERFVRGDSSRTDGGSGLGLSIAKSFTESCGGKFTIEIDGDMFKASVAMPIIEKTSDGDNAAWDAEIYKDESEAESSYTSPLLTDRTTNSLTDSMSDNKTDIF